MNRKQRRAFGPPGAGPSSGAAANTAPAGTLAELFAAAVAQHQAGALAEAERRYRYILTLFSDHAETHSRLGAVLMAQGKTGEAISHIERAIALKPDLFEAHANLGQAYLAAGQVMPAVEAAKRALELRETPPGKILFAQYVKLMRFTDDNDGGYRKLVLRALAEGWARPRELANVCISIIKLNRVVNECIARAKSAWPACLPAAELFGPSGMAAVLDDELLTCLLQYDPVTDIGLECLLTNVRQVMLTIATGDEAVDERHLKFYAAVARQCFINEYVYALPQAEADRARGLQSMLEQAIKDGAPVPAMWPIAVGAYFPLHTVSGVDALLGRSWPQCVDALLVQQVKEPAQERRIAATIPVLTGIEGEVSRAVRQQYEENPYPRWSKAGPPLQPAILNHRPPERVPDVLIAGCGTGLSTIEFALQMRNARILAIDLSLASLSYAKRMAEIFGLTNVEFAQADLMLSASIGRQFDFIDVSGVLHHLADPWAGWRVLLAQLRPGGIMQVGLYSELARQNIVAARALIAERGYRPSPEDIRRCREFIIASDDPLLKSVVNLGDFFTTGECRDLLFHVQEHRITLREIKAFLAANEVEFAGFVPVPSILQRFAARFPERSALLDLDCWASFETEAPQTFAAMYLFWVRKPAAPSNRTAANTN